jgi:hypothetical protein
MPKKYLESLILAAVLALCYALTLAPDLSWANGGADGGDLISAAATNGIAHPSGYPLYLLLAHAFQWIPVGTLAFRTNLFSAVCTVLAALAFQRFLRQQISPNVALIAGLALGLAPAIWSQAVITEVYGLQSLLLVLFLWGMMDENLCGGEWMRGLLFGLALGNHLTTLLLLPLLLLRTAPEVGLLRPAQFAKRVFTSLVMIVVFCCIFWLRANFNSPINWGNPVTLANLWWLVSGKMYANYTFNISPPDVLLRLRAFGGLLLEQFTIPGVLLGIYGLFSGLPRRMVLISLWMFVSFAGFAIVYGSYDSQVYLIPAYIAFILWMAYGLQDLLDSIPPKLTRLVVTVIVLGLTARIPFTIPVVDASHDHRAEQFGALFAAKTPQHAIVFASGDEAVFALWYFHYAFGQRPDTIIIADELLVYPWYAETLMHTYPSIKLTVSGTSRYEIIARNSARPVCYVSSESLNQDEFCGTSP